MMPRRSTLLALCSVAALASACGSSPPPQKPVVTKQPVAMAKPPPAKPKPKPCVALDEQCASVESTKAKIAASDLVFRPPQGWIYAQGEKATVGQTADDGPAVILAEVDVGDAKDAKKAVAGREAALEELAKEINVSLPKKKLNWKKPDDTKEIADMKVGLWQVEGGARGEKKGPLLVFSGLREGSKELLGLGFVPGDDSSKADEAILTALDTIDSGGKAGAGDKDDAGKKPEAAEKPEAGKKPEGGDKADAGKKAEAGKKTEK